MSTPVLAVVVFAALLHATWNAIIKRAEHKLFSMILVTSAAGLLAALALPCLDRPAAASWPFLAASCCFQVGYYVLVAKVYRTADMSQCYPLMRGTAPLLVALASRLCIGEGLSWTAWGGVALICSGVTGMWLARGRGGARGMGLALGTAVLIAGYTLIDGLGVRRSGAPAAYTLWLSALTAVPLLSWALLTEKTAFLRYASGRLHQGLIGGIGTLASYGLALWAMTRAPVAMVAALRETSILFALGISAVFLKERPGRPRVVMACAIAAGAILMRLA